MAVVLAAAPVLGIVAAIGRRLGDRRSWRLGLLAGTLTVLGSGYAATTLPAWPLVLLGTGLLVLLVAATPRRHHVARSTERFQPVRSATQLWPSAAATAIGATASFWWIGICLGPGEFGTKPEIGLVYLVLIMPAFAALVGFAAREQGTPMTVTYPLAATGVIPLFLLVPYGLGADFDYYWVPFVPAAVALVSGLARLLGRTPRRPPFSLDRAPSGPAIRPPRE